VSTGAESQYSGDCQVKSSYSAPLFTIAYRLYHSSFTVIRWKWITRSLLLEWNCFIVHLKKGRSKILLS